MKRAIEAIVARAEGVTADSDVGDQVRGELQRALDEWQARIDHGRQTGAPLVYEADDATALLQPLEKGFEDTAFTCPNSLSRRRAVGGLALARADRPVRARSSSVPVRVGDLRPSSILTTFGVGSIVDLPRMSVLVRGLEDWTTPDERIEEPRLLAAVRSAGLDKVTDLHVPPRSDPDGSDANKVGVGVIPFPGWLLCPVCRLLARRDSGHFSLEKSRYSIDQNGYRHKTCPKAKGASPWAIPVRFIAACEAGHLDDFPWIAFTHGSNPVCEGPVRARARRGR